MNKIIKTRTFFNLGTQRALYEGIGGYVKKEVSLAERLEKVKKEYQLDKIYRFDLGENSDGCHQGVVDQLTDYLNTINKREYLGQYPEFVCYKLRQKIAELHGICPDDILLSAGLDQMLIMIASTFLELNDRVVVNNPSFFLFEEYSQRMGAITIQLHLEEKDKFQWTRRTLHDYRDTLDKLKPKLIWIANPNNPTGLSLPDNTIEEIIHEAANHFCFIVIDEAYGEFKDHTYEVNSASKFLKEYNNVIVLRTFSKAYGLANLRVGYAMTSDRDIFNALKLHCPYFPITQFSFDMVYHALNNQEYLDEVRKVNYKRKQKLIQKLEKIRDLDYIPSETNIMMIGCKHLSSIEIQEKLEKYGIIVSSVPGDDYISRKYFRFTICSDEENQYFANSIAEILSSKK
ncbi:MAG: histidinol-phosphate aminotransferase family protein [Spirochaetes bacterium]|nr:histidinol-phosphate aminotransferase family protein [Spirochaetota bacterium]